MKNIKNGLKGLAEIVSGITIPLTSRAVKDNLEVPWAIITDVCTYGLITASGKILYDYPNHTDAEYFAYCLTGISIVNRGIYSSLQKEIKNMNL